MNYILVEPEKLEGKYDYKYSERVPDGRVILPISVMKLLTGIRGVDMVSLAEIKEMKKESPSAPLPNEEQSGDVNLGDNEVFIPEAGYEGNEETVEETIVTDKIEESEVENE